MATYVFRCQDCSTFEVLQPMTDPTRTHPCPDCGAESARVFTPPSLKRLPTALDRAIDTAGSSAGSPPVVRSIPAGAPRPRKGVTPTTAVSAGTARTRRPYPPLPRS